MADNIFAIVVIVYVSYLHLRFILERVIPYIYEKCKKVYVQVKNHYIRHKFPEIWDEILRNKEFERKFVSKIHAGEVILPCNT